MSSPVLPPTRRQGFPWMYVLRWVVGGIVLLLGCLTLYQLTTRWAYMADQAIIDPAMAPMRYLPSAVLRVALGAMILLRTRYALAIPPMQVVSLVMASPATLADMARIPLFWFTLSECAAMAVFLVLLRSRGLLR